MKNGRKTWYPWGQKAIFFVQRKPFSDPQPLKQLVNRHGLRLAMLSDGKVKGDQIQQIYTEGNFRYGLLAALTFGPIFESHFSSLVGNESK